MHHQSLFLFALCAAAVYSVGALPSNNDVGFNYESDAHVVRCTNSVNGNVTAATDVDGNVILGCNNTISGNTVDGTAKATVEVYGSDNVIINNTASGLTNGGSHGILVGSSSSSDTANGNVVVSNVADYIALYRADGNLVESNEAHGNGVDIYSGVYNSTVRGNVARGDGYNGNGGIWVFDDTSVVLSDNDADYMEIVYSAREVVKHNVDSGTDSSNSHYMRFSNGENDVIEDNTAVRAGRARRRRRRLACLALLSRMKIASAL